MLAHLQVETFNFVSFGFLHFYVIKTQKYFCIQVGNDRYLLINSCNIHENARQGKRLETVGSQTGVQGLLWSRNKNTVNQYSALQVKNVKISYKKFGFVEWQRSILDHPYQNGVHDKPECYMDQKETNWVPLEEERHGPGRQ